MPIMKNLTIFERPQSTPCTLILYLRGRKNKVGRKIIPTKSTQSKPKEKENVYRWKSNQDKSLPWTIGTAWWTIRFVGWRIPKGEGKLIPQVRRNLGICKELVSLIIRGRIPAGCRQIRLTPTESMTATHILLPKKWLKQTTATIFRAYLKVIANQ